MPEAHARTCSVIPILGGRGEVENRPDPPILSGGVLTGGGRAPSRSHPCEDSPFPLSILAAAAGGKPTLLPIFRGYTRKWFNRRNHPSPPWEGNGRGLALPRSHPHEDSLFNWSTGKK
jgi:hypothetical protein